MGKPKTETETEIRDAVMIYLVQVLDLWGEEMAFMARRVYSPTFLIVLKCIRLENKIEDFSFFNLRMLDGISRTPGEDIETLGDKLVEWVQETLEEFRKPLED